jgi:hypothetical protein
MTRAVGALPRSAGGARTSRLFPSRGARTILNVMESQSPPAEEFPGLYRAILDGVMELERDGMRREAALVRAEATSTYSSSWDAAGRRRLLGLLRRIERVREGRERPREQRGRRPALRRSPLPGR